MAECKYNHSTGHDTVVWTWKQIRIKYQAGDVRVFVLAYRACAVQVFGAEDAFVVAVAGYVVATICTKRGRQVRERYET